MAEEKNDALDITPDHDRVSPFARGVKKYRLLAVSEMSIIIDCVSIAKLKEDL